MKLNYVNSPENDFSRGIDARSAENQIEPEFVRDLLNGDVIERRVRKRPGYQGYGGNIPFRVLKMEYDNVLDEVCFTLDSAVELSTSVTLETTRSSPIVVYGRSSTFTSGQGPFNKTTDIVKYYSSFRVPLRKSLTAPSGTLTIPGTEHGLGTTNLFVSVYESTSLTNRSYEKLFTDSISINETTFDVSIGYTTSTNKEVFVVFADKDTVGGASYVHAALAVGTGTQNISIPTATHGLSNFNIVVQVQQDTGTARDRIIPDEVTIDSSGNVVVTVVNGTGAVQDYYVLLSAAPVINQKTGSIGASTTSTITIPNVTSPWIFYAVYLEQTPGGTLEAVLPDSIVYDDITEDVTLTFTNEATTARNFKIYYEYGAIRSNQLCVSDTSVTFTGTDNRPQISIWGLDHEDVYLSKENREAWTTHVDSYRRSGEQRLVCGLGGNLFTAREYSESGTQYSYPLLFPNLFARTSSSRILAPLFWDSTETPGRTRGYITSTEAGLHWARVTAVAFDASNTWTKLTLSLPSKAVLDSTGTPTALSSVISVTSGLEDWITVQDMSYARHNGSFRIRKILDGTNQIFIWVENANITNTDYDDSGTGGEAGVFTDQFVWTANAPFISGDALVSDALEDILDVSALASSTTTTVADGIVDRLELAAGILINGQRKSSLIPTRSTQPNSVASVTNAVRGDMLSYTEIDRELRILHINPDTNRTVNIAVVINVATVTLTTGNTSFLTIGQKVLLLEAGKHSGVHTVTKIPSLTTFEYETNETAAATGAVLLGKTIEIDEELTWEDTPGDTNSFRSERRWIPVEAPDDSFDLTPLTYIRHLDMNSYSNQPFLRSTMVVDNMYFTNDSDEAYKFDGTNIYRAGMFSWQPGLFLTQETTGATIVTDLRSLAYSARVLAEGKLTITATTQNILPIGSSVRLTGSTQTYTVSSYFNDGTNYFVLVDRSLDAGVAASGSLSEIGTFRYYYRVNAVDANSNIIASAVTGHQDHVVELTGNAAVQHRLVGMPAWDVYDYDRLEIEIYRTRMNQAAPFFRVTTLVQDFDNTQGYITYRDSFADSDLTELDKVNTALKGAEIGTNWSDPLRAKYITSIGNRLVLGNVRDYPQLDLQIVADANTANSAFAGDTLLFRRDNTNTGTTTDMVNRVKYEWMNGTTGTASAFVIGSNQFSFTTSTATGAVTGDWIYLTYSTVATTGKELTYSGWWQIFSVSGTTVTVNLVGAASASFYPDRYVIATDPTDVPVLLGTDGNLGMVNGDSFDVFDSMRRMSMALNTSMRMVDTTLTGMSTFTPWLVSRGGNDVTQAGRLIVRQPRADSVTFECKATFSGYDLFVNSIKRTTGDEISASTRVYPSRILVSYENYPELFDSPTAILDVDSDSAIDINSADGQEITGIIPFFGEAAFGSAQQSSILVVFKTNSVYLVDINQKLLGQNAVQRIETEGLGCTAPYSISVTKNGITFGNESGIYCLRRNQTIQYIGRYMERNWTEKVDLNSLAAVHGHHYGVGRAYKLSVPILSTKDAITDYIENSEVYVYNHTGEDEGRLGAWSRYDSHPAIGWANLASNAFFASTKGRVFIVRNLAQNTDFRDDNEAINMQLQTRSSDFGNSGIRKTVDKQIIHYRAGARSTATTVSYAVDLEQEYSSSTTPIIPKLTVLTGTADEIGRDIITIAHSVERRRCTYFSTQIANAEIDVSVEVAGIDYKVGGLLDRGILDAKQSQSK